MTAPTETEVDLEARRRIKKISYPMIMSQEDWDDWGHRCPNITAIEENTEA
jgi:hypothetical protein